MKHSTSHLRLAGIVVLTLAVAACSSPKKTPPPVAAVTPPPAATQAAPQPPRQAEPPRASNLPPPAANTGPAPGSVQEFIVKAGDRIYFDYDSAQVRADATSILDAQAAWLQRYPQVAVRVDGNADERGTREYNFALGAERANAVKEYLIKKGVGAARIETVSYGKERPIDAGTSEDSLARNRNGHTAITGGAR